MQWRTVALVALVVLFGLMFSSHFHDLADVVEVLRRGQPGWLVVAAGLQLLWFWNRAVLYRSIYDLLGLPARTARLLPIVLASNFLNFATPSASLGAAALLLAAAALVISGLVLAALWSDRLARLLGWLGRRADALGGALLDRDLLAEERARR